MRYNVAQLLKEPVGSTRSHIVDEYSIPSDQIFPEMAKGQLRLMRTDWGILATVNLEAMVPGNCSRCLEHFIQPVTLSIEEEFLARMDVYAGRPLPVPEEAESAFFIDASNILDLHEAVRQYAITNIPMKPLCKPECLGLCTICGGNRNYTACACGVESSDPPWAPLKQLLESTR